MIKRQQAGFTLIELMIVVMIIGILSSIAIPYYDKYIKRAELLEPQILWQGIQLYLEIEYIENGYPADLQAAIDEGIVLDGQTISGYTYDYNVSLPKLCFTLTSDFGDGPNTSKIGWIKVAATATKTAHWSCKNEDGACTDIRYQYLPKTCRS